MKKWERLAANVATEDDPDGMLGECDEKGAGGFWDHAGELADNMWYMFDEKPDFLLLQDFLYKAIKELFEEE